MAQGEVTRLIAAVREGRDGASGELFEVVYRELRQVAGRYMRDEKAGHTLQATAVVHDAYLRLTSEEHLSFENRAHFFGVAANVMRRVLIDHARTRAAEKRGGRNIRVPLDDAMAAAAESPVALLDLDIALERLATLNPRHARVVELRYFGGLTLEEAADSLGLTPRTVARDWRLARAWLKRELTAGGT